jgi:hypothetical protein
MATDGNHLFFVVTSLRMISAASGSSLAVADPPPVSTDGRSKRFRLTSRFTPPYSPGRSGTGGAYLRAGPHSGHDHG